MATLYLVATPIGNLEDFSPRGQRILNEVSLIAAEDTRHSRKLLNHFEIPTPLTSYFEHSRPTKLAEIIKQLDAGSDIALISDAGTPAINDPGYLLVRAALDAGHVVSPIPGPSAPITALAASGLPTDTFIYLGYLPRKEKARREFLQQNSSHSHTLIFLETPHRIQAALADLLAILGDRQIAVAAELTKRFERYYRGSLSAAQTFFEDEPARGEFTIVVEGQPKEKQIWDEARVINAVREGLAGPQSTSQLARLIAADSGWQRNLVYDLLVKERNQKE
jgi:16S rRNA (cytidine1402-2'-O)-methyltransferase